MFSVSLKQGEGQSVTVDVSVRSGGYSLMLAITPSASIYSFTQNLYRKMSSVTSWSTAAVGNGTWFSFSTHDISDIHRAILALREYGITDVLAAWEQKLQEMSPEAAMVRHAAPFKFVPENSGVVHSSDVVAA